MRTGGAERHWATLIPELHDRGIAVKLLALADTGPFFEDVAARGVPAECLGLHRRTNPRALRLALSVGAAFEPDAVVTRGVSGQLVGEAIARRSHAVHVMNEHTPLMPDGRLVPPRPHQRALTRLVARRVDGVIAVTRRQVPPLETARIPAWTDRRGAERGVRARRSGGRGVAGARGRVLRAVRVGTAAGEARGPVHRGGGRGAPRQPGDPRLRGRRGDGARAARAARGGQWGDAARSTARRARPDPRRGCPLPAERGGGAADEHPGGDGARAARWWPPTWAGSPSRSWTARPATWCPPATRSRSGTRCSRSPPIRSAPARWARPGAGASASASSGDAMVDGYVRVFEEAVASGQA